jgi:hypothetical protein
METNVLMTSFLFGLIGLGMFLHGKKAGRFVPLGAGLLLMIIPYFITSFVWLLVVCCLLVGTPWIIREG